MSSNNDFTLAAFSESTPNPVVIAQVNHVDISTALSPNENAEGWPKELYDPVNAGEMSIRQAHIQRAQQGPIQASYSTLSEAIEKGIIEPIETTGISLASDYDIDAIIDHALAYDRQTQTWFTVLGTEQFWELVESNAIYVPPNDEPEGIILYSNDGCLGCSLTAKAFDRAGLEYTEINLATRPDLVAQFKQEGLSALPIITDGQGQTISGYRPDRIKAIIEAGRPPKTANTVNTVNAGEPVKTGVTPKAVNTGVEPPRMNR